MITTKYNGHDIYCSDSSVYDVKCHKCGRVDEQLEKGHCPIPDNKKEEPHEQSR